MKKLKKQTDYFYIPVYMTEDGDIYVDFSSRNKENKVIFRRVHALEIVTDVKNQDWNIANEIKKINFYLQKDGQELAGPPVDMVLRIKKVSKTLREKLYYYFIVPKKILKSRINDNILKMDFEDFLANENIDNLEKLAVTFFFNGEIDKVY